MRSSAARYYDVVAPLVPAVKPRMAFYEQLGLEGMQALKTIVDRARSAGLLVILDGKRNDIGTTAEAYADGLLGMRVLGRRCVDRQPLSRQRRPRAVREDGRDHDAGLFVLVKTSNPGSGQFKTGRLSAAGGGESATLYRLVANEVKRMSAASGTGERLRAVGAVVGTTSASR